MKVEISRFARKQLQKMPQYIIEKLKVWVDAVEHEGIEEVRKIPGYHDEPLKGFRKGQRSVRLNRSYRAIYIMKQDVLIEFVSIEEVSKHDY